jgi:hypothetical protein
MAEGMGISGSGSHSTSKSKASLIPEISGVSDNITYDLLQKLPLIVQMLQQQSPELAKTLQGTSLQDLAGLNQQQFGQAQQFQQQELAQNKDLSPEFYSAKEATGRNLMDLLNPALSGSELSNIERGLNRQFVGQGTFNTPTQANLLTSAMTYGNAGRERQQQGVQAFNQTAPNLLADKPGLKYSPVATDQSLVTQGADAAKMLFTNPTEAATAAYTAAIGNQKPKQRSSSGSGGGGVSGE